MNDSSATGQTAGREEPGPIDIPDIPGSFYEEDLWKIQDGSVVQVCDGTSCRLGGSKTVEQLLHRYGHDCQKVYCLGFCDRSPVSMIPYDLTREQSPANIRCVAPEAIITRRILDGPVSGIREAVAAGIYEGLLEAFRHSPEHLVKQVEMTDESGRNTEVIPTGKKWRNAAESQGNQKYIVANGDEGDPGSFVDRILMEQDPHTIIEGMILAGYATGATEGIIYMRSEYPRAVEIAHEAIEEARSIGYLGKRICGSDFSFDIQIFVGKGSYACGTDAALITSIEGLRSENLSRPDSNDRTALHGQPTVVSNLETLSKIPFIALKGGAEYAVYGTHATPGTKAICLNYGFENPGLVEVEFGITFREVIQEIAGDGREGETLAAVLIGGPRGTILTPDDWGLPICHEVLQRHGIQLGHGGIVAIPESTDFHDLLVHFTEFMIRESCGGSAPCRQGARAFLEAISTNSDQREFDRMLSEIEQGNLSAFGQFVPGPIRTLLKEFPERALHNN